jgi:UDP-glucuronate 4-epimerase
MKTILVTGAAGFIGFHATQMLVKMGHKVIGVDNLDPYYNVELKKARLKELDHPAFTMYQIDICDSSAMIKIAIDHEINCVLHLAAQPGVRYSMENPSAYLKANIQGQLSILELCRRLHCKLVYASSSSVYGAATKDNTAFREEHMTNQPLSFYAATKCAGEAMAHSYSHLYGFDCIGLRFFTVYGPWGRPDMAIYQFAEDIMQQNELLLYDDGNLFRDFTYIDDIVEGIKGALFNDKLLGSHIYNLGRGKKELLRNVVNILEATLGKAAKIRSAPCPKGDVHTTLADITKAKKDLDFHPQIDLQQGIPRFIEWYQTYTQAAG